MEQKAISPLARRTSKKTSRKITEKGLELKKMIDNLLTKGCNSDMEECSDFESDSCNSG